MLLCNFEPIPTKCRCAKCTRLGNVLSQHKILSDCRMQPSRKHSTHFRSIHFVLHISETNYFEQKHIHTQTHTQHLHTHMYTYIHIHTRPDTQSLMHRKTKGNSTMPNLHVIYGVMLCL